MQTAYCLLLIPSQSVSQSARIRGCIIMYAFQSFCHFRGTKTSQFCAVVECVCGEVIERYLRNEANFDEFSLKSYTNTGKGDDHDDNNELNNENNSC